MSAQIIDGFEIARQVREDVAKQTASLKEKGITPCLAVILVGENPASVSYVTGKEKALAEVGMADRSIRLPENTTEDELLKIIDELNHDKTVHGILVQLPLPKHIDEEKVIMAISPEKDVDGFSEGNVGRLTLFSDDALFSCTPYGMIKLLEYYDIPLAGKHAVVVGRSNIVGKPMSLMLLRKNCTVTTCHRHTEDLAKYTSQADILVVAVGKKHLITADMVKEGVVVVDAGINRVDGKIYGDVDFEGVSKKASYITPVPGGVGPMTITMLLYNTYLAGIRND
jgi:methylenetetrahydrofolate dehydrogenase (NADP+)/methenyltetrahydrofolate cyclohydrolase